MPEEILELVPEPLHQTLQNYWIDWQQACQNNKLDPVAGIDLA